MSSLLESIKNKRQAIAAKSGRERPAKLTSAKNMIRLMPNWAGDENGSFSQDFGQHFIKDKNEAIQAVYICTATTFGRECAVCSEIARHSAEITDEDQAKILSDARSSSRVLVNAIYINGTHANAKTDPVLLELPVSVFNDILGIMENYLEDHDLNILDLKEGYDLVINKSGSGRETKYTVTPSPKARAIPAETLAKCKDLDAYAKQEYDAGLQKAIASLSAVVGRSSSTPALAGPKPDAPVRTQQQALSEQEPVNMDVLEADYAEVPTDNEPPFDTQEEAPVTRAKPAAKPAAKPTPVATVDADLDDLDALVAELENAA
jgi:hypothetical protein